MILSTSLMSFRFSARGSLTSIAITFQSVSPFNENKNDLSNKFRLFYLINHGKDA